MPETTQAGPCGELHEKLSACVSANVSVIDFYKLWVGTILWGWIFLRMRSIYLFSSTLWVNRLRWFQKMYRNGPFLPKTESPRESYLIISAEHKWILNYFSGRRWLWRSQCATSTMPCRQLCLENETTLLHHLVANYRYRFYRSFQYAITIIRCPINYFVSLSNSCFIFCM